LYAKGQGVKQDYFKAKEFYKKGCDGGDAGGCFILGVLYYDGQGVRKSNVKAKEFFGKACDMGDNNGCKNYAILNQ
jgi:TPR repeat protein